MNGPPQFLPVLGAPYFYPDAFPMEVDRGLLEDGRPAPSEHFHVFRARAALFPGPTGLK